MTRRSRWTPVAVTSMRAFTVFDRIFDTTAPDPLSCFAVASGNSAYTRVRPSLLSANWPPVAANEIGPSKPSTRVVVSGIGAVW